MLEQAIQLFERIRDAHDRQKGLPQLIDKYVGEIIQTKGIVELVKNENSLKTPSVGGAINRLDSVGKALLEHLTRISNTKGPIQDFFYQLVSGKKGEDKLENIMKDLGNAKMDLSIQIQVANVGLIQAVGQAVQVNTAAVEKINKMLIETLGSGHVLRISQLIEGRSSNGKTAKSLTRSSSYVITDGTLTLTKEDIALLAEPAAPAATKTQGFSGIIRENEAIRKALQINTPIGVDIWKGMNLFVEGNKATDQACQINGPMSEAAFRALLEAKT